MFRLNKVITMELDLSLVKQDEETSLSLTSRAHSIAKQKFRKSSTKGKTQTSKDNDSMSDCSESPEKQTSSVDQSDIVDGIPTNGKSQDNEEMSDCSKEPHTLQQTRTYRRHTSSVNRKTSTDNFNIDAGRQLSRTQSQKASVDEDLDVFGQMAFAIESIKNRQYRLECNIDSLKSGHSKIITLLNRNDGTQLKTLLETVLELQKGSIVIAENVKQLNTDYSIMNTHICEDYSVIIANLQTENSNLKQQGIFSSTCIDDLEEDNSQLLNNNQKWIRR